MTDIRSLLVILGICINANSLCNPGQLWDPNEGVCKTCPLGSFQRVEGLAEFCQLCKKVCIDPVMLLEETCTPTRDNTCVCPEGTFFVSKDGQDRDDGYCKKHRKCGSGWRLKKEGTHIIDTSCEPCERETFSPDDSPVCYPCDHCGYNMEVLIPCSRSSNTVCRRKEHNEKAPIGWILGIIFSSIVCLVIGALGHFLWTKYRDKKNVKDEEVPLETGILGGRRLSARQSDLDREGMFQNINSQLGKDWEDFFRRLFFLSGLNDCQSVIDDAVRSRSCNPADIKYKVYRAWLERTGEGATTGLLKDALVHIKRMDILHSLD